MSQENPVSPVQGHADTFFAGSAEERDDLKKAYTETKGSIADIMTHIPHSTYEDEPRFITIIQALIASKELPDLKAWRAGIKDDKSKAARKKAGKKEAKEAEEAAKELGVWDEFYGSGKKGDRKGKGKKTGQDTEGEDHSALQALILAKQKKSQGFFDDLAAKYADGESKTSKKRGARGGEPPAKRARGDPPKIDDDEFAKLQEKLFSNKPKKTRK